MRDSSSASCTSEDECVEALENCVQPTDFCGMMRDVKRIVDIDRYGFSCGTQM